MQRWIDYDGTWTVEGVKEEIKAARAQLWCIHKDEIVGVIVTRVHETDSTKIGHVWGCGGDLKPVKDETLAFFEVIEDWFRDMGCKFVDWTGRAGWERILPDYQRHAVVMRKRL